MYNNKIIEQQKKSFLRQRDVKDISGRYCSTVNLFHTAHR